MDEYQQLQLLQRLVTDTESSVGAKVVYEPYRKKELISAKPPRSFHLKTPHPTSPGKQVFAYARIKPVVACLGISTWEKCLKDADIARMPHCEFVRGLQYGEGGRRWKKVCRTDDEAYREVVYALSKACRYCLW